MKQAYPNFDAAQFKYPLYDLQKWMNSFRDIYIKVHLGANKTAAINEICDNWGTVEKREFLDWMKYYETGDYLKYKKAQSNAYYVNDDINYFLPNPKSVVPSPLKSLNDQMKDVPQQAAAVAEIKKQEGPSPAEKRQQIENQRKKILGRLNSVEKLLSSPDGHMFAGPDFERLLISIYELKKQIQTVNKISLSAQTCIDLIVRQANILKRDGFDTASTFMVKFAQNSAGELNTGMGAIPGGGSAPQGLGALNNDTPDLSATPPPGLDNLPTDTSAPIPSGMGKGGVEEFLDNLEGAGITDELDESKIEDDNSDEDEVDVGSDDVLLDQEIEPNGKDLFVEAQLAPPMDLPPAAKPRIPKDDIDVAPPLEVSEDKPTAKKPSVDPETPKSDVDMLLDNALQNVSVQDLVQKLDNVATIFRNREISRQLAICDILFSKLGIASYFSEFSECINKSFDSGNYILTRLESTISKLRGAMGASTVELDSAPEPQNTGLQKTLKGLEDKEKAKKEMRQQLSDKKIQEQVEGGEKPELEVEEIPDLTKAPSKAEAPAPPPPPKVPPANV